MQILSQPSESTDSDLEHEGNVNRENPIKNAEQAYSLLGNLQSFLEKNGALDADGQKSLAQVDNMIGTVVDKRNFQPAITSYFPRL